MDRDNNEHRSLSLRFSETLSRPTTRWLLLLAALTLLAVAWPSIDAVQYDRQIESLLPSSSPSVQAFSKMRDQLGGADSIVVVWPEPSLLASDGQGMLRLQTIVQTLNELESITGTLSLIELNHALKMMGAREEFPVLSMSNQLAAIFRELFAGYTHSVDGKWAGVVVLFRPDADHATTIDKVRNVVDTQMNPQETAFIVGEPAIIVEGFSLLESDGKRLSLTILLLLSAVLLLLLRRIVWIVAVVAIVLWSRWLTRALIAWSGMRLTMISGMLEAVLTVVAVATMMHIALRYSAEAARADSQQAAQRTWFGLLSPIVWSLITTAVGFGSLAFSSIVPVRQFGLMMALGTGVVFVSMLLIGPAFLGPPLVPSLRAPHKSHAWIRRKLLQTLQGVTHHAPLLAGLALLVAGLSVFGISRLQVETNFLNNFRSDSPIVRSYRIVETQFGGAGVWDILLPAPERLNNAYIRLVYDLEQDLRDIQADSGMKLTKVLSLADADLAAKSQSRLLAIAGPTVRLKGMQLAIPAFYDALVSSHPPPEESLFRILLRSNEQATAAEKLQLISRVEACVARHLALPEWQEVLAPSQPSPESDTTKQNVKISDRSLAETPAYVTGYYVLLTQLVAGLLADQWNSFLIASVGIVLCVRLAIGRWDLAFAATLPSVLPILVVLGTLGFLGVGINLGAAMIAAVSVGLSIDGSIHYLHTYQVSQAEGHTARGSLQRAQRSTGLAISIATVALALGLLTLATSPLKPTATFGLLSGITLLAGLAGNLVLLPALIVLLESRNRLRRSPNPKSIE